MEHLDQEDRFASCWSATHAQGGPVAIKVECVLGRGFSGMTMIGGAGQVCEDGKERAKAALERLGWNAPARRIIISISPGDVRVDQSHLDLAIAVLLAQVTRRGQWSIRTSEWLMVAEIGLNGELRPVSGVVGWAAAAQAAGLAGIVVATSNLQELHCFKKVSAALDPKFSNALECVGFSTLDDALSWLESGIYHERVETPAPSVETPPRLTFDDMDLPGDLRQVAMVAAAGMHSLLLRGSPGTGKSMFARRLASILPPVFIRLQKTRIATSL